MYKGPQPTEAEFEELKRVRNEQWRAIITATSYRLMPEGFVGPIQIRAHVSHGSSTLCYCDCPDGPCQHVWDGEPYESEDQLMWSTTCSRCGMTSFHHDMRFAP